MGARLSLTIRELKKWIRNPANLFITLIQPIFWIVLFGSAFDITKIIPPSIPGGSSMIMGTLFMGAKNYISFLTPGMLAIMALFSAMFSGMSIIWDRRFGYLTRLLVSPIPRDSIVLSKVFSSTIKAIVQSTILFIIAILIPNGLYISSSFNIYDLIGVFAIISLLSIGFSGLFSIIVIRVKKMETLMAIVNLLNLPLMFASTAMFPADIMPDWLKGIASYNPISWAANSLRYLILQGSWNSTLFTDIAYLLIFDAIIILAVFVVSKYGFEE
ncbi:MAG: ABC transporter permease [Thermoplasmata archaeon]|jgi:ABC-2 type transport system permease protein